MFKFFLVIKILILVSALCTYEFKASFLLPDLQPMTVQNSFQNYQKGDYFFPITWFDGYYGDGNSFRFSDWIPYYPEYQLVVEEGVNDHISRLKLLEKDNVITGIVVYHRYRNENHIKLVEDWLSEFDFQLFIQIYDLDDNDRAIPLKSIPKYYHSLAKNKNVHWYFADDFNYEFWDRENTTFFSNQIRKKFPDKKLLTASRIRDYIERVPYIFDLVDIISPQIYPTRGGLLQGQSLTERIPEFVNCTEFHYNVLKFKEKIYNHNLENENGVFFNVTLGSYHINAQSPRAVVARFPTYDEFRFQVYSAIVGGAKGFNIFCLYRTSLESYKNSVLIFKEFKNTGFEKAVLYGDYYPELIDFSSIIINKDLGDSHGKHINDLDFCVYYHNFSYYLIILNTSRNTIKKELKYNLDGYRRANKVSLNPETGTVLYQPIRLEQPKTFKPFEVKLIIIQ